MKVHIKNFIIAISLVTISSCISVYATITYRAQAITYTPANSNFAVQNTNEALDYLYNFSNNTTAQSGDILLGKTAFSNGNLLTGTMPNNGALNWKPNTSTTYIVPSGYYSGGILDSTDAFIAGLSQIDNLKTLWNPVGRAEFSFSGTYNFTKNYKYVIVTFSTECSACKTYSTNNMPQETKNIYFGVSSLESRIMVYKNVNTGASVSFSFDVSGYTSGPKTTIAIFGIE